MRLAALCPGAARDGGGRPRQPAAASRPSRRRKPRRPSRAPKSPFTPPAFKITIATEGAYPPFNYLDRKGMPAGFEMELAQEACQRMKAECEFVAVKWDELIPGLIDKKFDIIMSSLEVTSERRKRLGMSRRYYLSPGAFIAAKGAPFDGPPSLLRNKRIGVQKRFHPCRLGSTRASAARAQLKRYNTARRGAEGAGQRRGRRGVRRQGAALAVEPEARRQMLRGGRPGHQGQPDAGRRRRRRPAQEDIKLRDALNKAFGEMMTDGTYKKINEKYFPFPLN